MFRAAFRLLAPAERARVIRLLPVFVLNGLFEVVGAVSVIPFLALVADPGVVERWSGRLPPWLAALTVPELTGLAGLACLATLVGTNGFFIVAQRLTIRFAADLDAAMSSRVLRAITGRPYPFFLGRNASALAETAIGETWRFVYSVALPALEFVARLFVVITIVGLLVAIDPVVSVAAGGLLGGCYALVYAGGRRRIAACDAARVGLQSTRWRLATEALAGIKDLKVGGTTGRYLAEYARVSRAATRLEGTAIHYARLPRYVMETFAFGLVVILALVLVRRSDGGSVIPALGLYAYAGYRLLPAMFTCYVQMITVRSNASVIDRLAEFLGTPGAAEPPAAPPRPLARSVAFRDVSFAYEGSARPALQAFDLELPAGRRTAVVGGTGAGKSTVLDLLLGLLSPSAGTVAIDGEALDEAGLPAWRAAIGYVPQSVFIADDTLAANIALGVPPDQVDPARLAEAARAAALDDLVDLRDPRAFDRAVGEAGARLSGGQRQRLGIARALYRRPALLVLDEATGALDPATEARVLASIAGLPGPVTLVAVTHRVETTRDFDLVVVIEGGRVVGQGRYEALARECPAFRDLLAARSRDAGPDRLSPAFEAASP